VSFLSLGREPRFRSGGTPRTVEDAELEENERHNEEVRSARIEVARRNPRWTEIPEARLVRRGLGYLVDAETDLVYTLRRGETFVRGTSNSGYSDHHLAFCVDLAGEVVMLELDGSATWSERVERRERRRLRVVR
jgi:hypothetical protein